MSKSDEATSIEMAQVILMAFLSLVFFIAFNVPLVLSDSSVPISWQRLPRRRLLTMQVFF